ncbi:Tyrosine--tRNA ligase [bioreactor metagenome]|uniref:Tyrosine--tRNA ligase n=1 Tax=bioreactor metagenome TaxID=1076179 RepID=A0A645IAZ1_9ZZZZ
MDEVRRLSALEGSEINKAKEVLAYEITKIVHGEEEAQKSETAAKMLFYGSVEGGSAPETSISKADIEKGMDVLSLLTACGLVPSRGEGRRLIQQGGLKLNDEKISDVEYVIKSDYFKYGTLLIQKGKKVFHHAKLV